MKKAVETYLRNRKHVPCFYRVIQTLVEVWENEKCCRNTSRRRVFPQLFRVLPNFHECLYNSIETRYMFSISFRKHHDAKKENNLLTLIIKMYFLFARAITTSTARASSVSVSSYTNTIFNQSARMLTKDCFLKYYIISFFGRNLRLVDIHDIQLRPEALELAMFQNVVMRHIEIAKETLLKK